MVVSVTVISKIVGPRHDLVTWNQQGMAAAVSMDGGKVEVFSEGAPPSKTVIVMVLVGSVIVCGAALRKNLQVYTPAVETAWVVVTVTVILLVIDGAGKAIQVSVYRIHFGALSEYRHFLTAIF